MSVNGTTQTVPRASLFRKTCCPPDQLNDMVNSYAASLTATNCTTEQVDAFKHIHKSTRPFVLTGAAGTGKSEVLVKIVSFFASLPTRPGLANTILLLASSNAHVDDMAVRIENDLAAVLDRQPVVLRLHSMKTEISLLVINKPETSSDPADPASSQPDNEITHPDFAVGLLKSMQNMHAAENSLSDRRLLQPELSLYALILRSLGLDHSVQRHDPLADKSPMRDDFADQLTRLLKLIAADSPVDQAELVKYYDLARNYIFTKLDVVCVTSSRSVDPMLHTDGTQPRGEDAPPGADIQPVMIIADEAERGVEYDIWKALDAYGEDIPLVIAGDLKQVGAVFGHVSKDSAEDQSVLSFMTEQIKLGATHVTLTQQTRYTEPIAKFIEKIFYKNELVAATKDHIPGEVHIKNYNKANYGGRLSMLFLDMKKDICIRIGDSPSRYNFAQARAAMEEVRKLLMFDIEGTAIGIASPYQDMTDLLQRMRAELAKDHPKALDVLIMNIDAMLGLERDIIILPLTVGRDLGFMSDTRRICVALTRCRVGFTIIGNATLMAQASNYHFAILSKVITDLKGRNALIALEEDDDDTLYTELDPVNTGESVEMVDVATCSRCNEFGNLVKDCPKPKKKKMRVCGLCLEEGHKKKRCPKAKVDVCDGCGERGHMVNDCSRRVCDACGETGHSATECVKPEPGPSRKKQKTDPFLDYSSPFLDY